MQFLLNCTTRHIQKAAYGKYDIHMYTCSKVFGPHPLLWSEKGGQQTQCAQVHHAHFCLVYLHGGGREGGREGEREGFQKFGEGGVSEVGANRRRLQSPIKTHCYLRQKWESALQVHKLSGPVATARCGIPHVHVHETTCTWSKQQ